MGQPGWTWWSLFILSLVLPSAISSCSSVDPCLNGGTCDLGTGLCSCVAPYTGTLCEGMCPTTTGWYSYSDLPGVCYFFSTVSGTWDAMQGTCRRSGGLLTSIRNQDEYDTLIAQTTILSQHYYIGFNLVDHTSSTANWLDGTPWTAFHTGLWDAGQGSVLNSNEFCGVIYANTMHDVGCQGFDFRYICRTDINECGTVTCQHGGTCSEPSIGQFVCTCEPGYTGITCGVNHNECSPNPCANLGDCTDGINEFSCDCASGWTGPTCEIDVVECDTAPCQNGGICSSPSVGVFVCACEPGWTGVTCADDIDECESNPCANEAVCVNGEDIFACICPSGFDGVDCSNDVDDCVTSPCANGGLCVDGVDSFSCDCLPGFSGHFCQFNEDDCALSRCENGGLCIDGANTYSCTCLPGYTSTYCEDNVDECSPRPCENGGTCVDGVNSYICNCAEGFAGSNCQTNVNACAYRPCENGGSCVDTVSSYTCDCVTGFSGPTCGTNDDDCDPDPCLNDGICTDGVDSYSCTCGSRFSGKDCEVAQSTDLLIPLVATAVVLGVLVAGLFICLIWRYCYNGSYSPPVQARPGPPSFGPSYGLPRRFNRGFSENFGQPIPRGNQGIIGKLYP